MSEERFQPFEEQFAALQAVVAESNRRAVREPRDELFYDNLNVFIKAYVVSACSILEVYVQEIACFYFDEINRKISSANIPNNIIVWDAFKDSKLSRFEFKAFSVDTLEQELRDSISGNFDRTVKAFKYIGVDILSSEEVQRRKDFIASFVDKRNKIVHHNDAASDLSLPDVVNAIDTLREYARSIRQVAVSSPHLA